jgi:dolichol-phosphate mannosyltransferase
VIYILLPAFNESIGIEILLQNISMQLSNQSYCLIVVNDGSTDNTLSILEKLQSKLNLKILNHEKNLGLGIAMQTGINYISDIINENDIVITMDADNTHPTDLFTQLIEKINNGFDIVIASRYAKGGKEIGLTRLRKILSNTASAMMSFFIPIKNVTDYTSGYRAYSGKIIKKSWKHYGKKLITKSGFTCMAEMLIKLFKINAKISEVGFPLRYDLKMGKSKIKIFRTIFDYFCLILRLKIEKY